MKAASSILVLILSNCSIYFKILIRTTSFLFRFKINWAMKSKIWITKEKRLIETLCLEILFTFFRYGQDINPQRLAWIWLLVLEKWLAQEKVSRFIFQIFSWGQDWEELESGCEISAMSVTSFIMRFVIFLFPYW